MHLAWPVKAGEVPRDMHRRSTVSNVYKFIGLKASSSQFSRLEPLQQDLQAVALARPIESDAKCDCSPKKRLPRSSYRDASVFG